MKTQRNKTLYHSALKKGSITYGNVNETLRADHPKGVMIKNDIIADGLPLEFEECDVLYAEPPWPHGFKVFNERAGVTGISYSDLADAIAKIILQSKIPVYLLMWKPLLNKLPAPQELHETVLHGGDALVGIWNDSYLGSCESANVICQTLGTKYKCFGDFTCGYGACVADFMDGGGKRFVASDYDGKCITVMSARMKKII